MDPDILSVIEYVGNPTSLTKDLLYIVFSYLVEEEIVYEKNSKYFNGILHGITAIEKHQGFFSLIETIPYHLGKKHGVVLSENGDFSIVETFVRGVMHGPHYEFYIGKGIQNLELIAHGNYVNGKKSGIWYKPTDEYYSGYWSGLYEDGCRKGVWMRFRSDDGWSKVKFVTVNKQRYVISCEKNISGSDEPSSMWPLPKEKYIKILREYFPDYK